MRNNSVVVVGASLAGARAVEALRDAGDDAPVVLVGEEQERPYERPELSKGYLAGATERGKIDALDPSWYDEHDVELRLGQAATRIDLDAGTVQVAGESLPFDRLLLATGSAPVTLGVPGADLEGVHYLRTVADSGAIGAAIAAGGPLVVIGGGWVGLEVAAVARGKGVEVTVVEPAPAPLSRAMGEQVGGLWADLHRRNGVDLRTGTTVAALHGDKGAVQAVETGDGARLEAAAVVVGVGIRPRTELAESAGLAVDDGIVVDGRLRTADPRVWAAGDVASAANGWAGRRLRVEHWANANDQGAFAGRSIAGAEAEWDVAPFFFSDQYDVGMEYRGWVDPRTAQVVLRGDTGGSGPWFAFWLVDGAVHAAMHVNGWDDAAALEPLVQHRRRVDPVALADPGTDLGSLVT